ncbi:MAG: T9SS type A sorting domain-containing protein [bacterium]
MNRVVLFLLIQLTLTWPTFAQGGFINFAHLDHLTETIAFDGDSMAIVHIFSKFPDYGWVNDEDEGMAAVDDAARATVAYLMHYQQFKDFHSLNTAKLLLKFLFHMQAADGGFYNFIWPDFSINFTGNTSNNNSFNFWASRALWAMGLGYNVFVEENIESELRTELETRINQAINKASSIAWNANHFQTKYGFQVPASSWLLNNGADQSSEAALGLAYYYEVTQSNAASDLLTRLCDGLVAFQLGDALEFPFSAHLPYVPDIFLWHGWGSRQTQALALAGRIMHRDEWIESAQNEADNFYLQILTSQQLHELRPGPVFFPQINYDVSPMVGGLIELFRATSDAKYAQYAGLIGTWWLGNNAQSFAMYDSTTGRCFDGLEVSGINLDSGAESVAEGLMSLQALYYTPEARSFLHDTVVTDNRYILLEGEHFSEILSGSPEIIFRQSLGDAQFSNNRYLKLVAGDGVAYSFTLENPFPDVKDYVLYLQFIQETGVADEIALDISLDRGPAVRLLQGGSSSRFLWVRHLSNSMLMQPGAHTLEVKFSGSNAATSANLDYLILQPSTQRKIFVNPAGDTVSVERHIPVVVSVDEPENAPIPETTILRQNYPNPFNPQTTIPFALEKSSFVTLKVYNLKGQEVTVLLQEYLPTGDHHVVWDAHGLPSGVYFCSLQTRSHNIKRKMILLR